MFLACIYAFFYLKNTTLMIIIIKIKIIHHKRRAKPVLFIAPAVVAARLKL
jgi:hypothetical protein